MITAEFAQAVTFTDEGILRRAFGMLDLSLEAGSSVTFTGRATLSPAICFSGDCRFGDGASIEQGAVLHDVSVGDGCRIRAYSVISSLTAGEGNLLGPFCFIRDGCVVLNDCILGAHVEATRSRFASGVKVSHRAFIGDAEIGERSIVGAGVVFCNYDGNGRQSTRVGAGVTIGSGSLLIPPLSIGDGALIAAGSLVNRDVPADATVIQKRTPG
jgi:bifunctional UDP-N-acetylglucosamine pyrophosphorylase/glucosamine-1-phosphate N-acetyltransferase